MFLSLALAAGFMISGLLLQRKIFSSAQMICISGPDYGYFSLDRHSASGPFIVHYPTGQTVGLLHDNGHVIAYGTLTLIGCGGMLGEMAEFKAMEDLQVTVINRGMGARSISSGLFYTMVTNGT